MSDRFYLQHGRRHATTGSDPIPGLGGSGLPWAVFSATPPNIDTDTFTILDLKATSPTFTVFDTSDSSIFAIAAGVGGNHGIQMKTNGLYVLEAVVQLTLNSTPATGSAVLSVLDGGAAFWPIATTDGALFIADVVTGGVYHADAQPSAFISCSSPDSPAPLVMNIGVQQNSGSSTDSVSVNGVIYQVSSSGATDF